MRLVVVAPKRILTPLVASLAGTSISREIVPVIRHINKSRPTDPYDIATIIARCPRETLGILLVIPRHLSVLKAIPSPVLHGVPIGLLPADTADDIVAWCDAMDRCHRQRRHTKSYLSLAMNTTYFKSQARLLAKNIRRAYRRKILAKNLFADIIARHNLIKKLAEGPSLVTYTGHSSLQGWEGYRKIRWKHVASMPCAYPCGVVMSISCDTLVHSRSGESFGSRLVTKGRVCAYMGAAGKVKMSAYSPFIRAAASVLATHRPATIGEFMVKLHEQVNTVVRQPLQTDWGFYRLIGNPLQRF